MLSASAVMLLCGLMASLLAIRIAIPLAHRFDVVDRPGGHKQHDQVTPFIGGVGVFLALLVSLTLASYFQPESSLQWLAVAVVGWVMFTTGLLDDLFQLSFKLRLLVQMAVALLMVFWGGVALLDLGSLAWGETLGLGYLAIPFTLFAVVGMINSLNMIDGIDGLSGSVSLVSLLLISLVAFTGGVPDYGLLALGLAGGVAGFLVFNLRYLSQHRARVFMGDNGTMLLGVLFAWMLTALTQGPSRAISPVAALWLLAVPLMDTVGVILRRVWLGKSPFRPDRHHLHHLFIRSGFRVQETVYAITLIQLVLGGIGILAFHAGVSELLMVAATVATFMLYFYLIVRPWRCVPALRRLHTLLGLPSADTRAIFLGHCALAGRQDLIDGINDEMGDRDDYQLNAFQTERAGHPGAYLYAVLELVSEDNVASLAELHKLADTLKRRFRNRHGIRVRQFLIRKPENDRRVGDKAFKQKKRTTERRSRHEKVLIHSVG
jgi:UDP-GlcNAc:undecaprenyl-phosphate GlcNAc-1-phosphate transferase